jgi:hypothetical protein
MPGTALTGAARQEPLLLLSNRRFNPNADAISARAALAALECRYQNAFGVESRRHKDQKLPPV